MECSAPGNRVTYINALYYNGAMDNSALKGIIYYIRMFITFIK